MNGGTYLHGLKGIGQLTHAMLTLLEPTENVQLRLICKSVEEFKRFGSVFPTPRLLPSYTSRMQVGQLDIIVIASRLGSLLR